MPDNDLPQAPHNFDHVERYAINLPLPVIEMMRNFALSKVDVVDADTATLVGFVLQLTEPGSPTPN